MKRIGVMTSGGDAPGMNAAIRAVARRGASLGIEVYGIRNGFKGLVEGDIYLLEPQDVGGILGRGGTMLYSARYPEFREEESQLQAIKQLEKFGIEAVVVIGGDGSFQGAKVLSDRGIPTIGIPGTIDNDIPGTDYTLGFDTTVNTVIDALDRISDTAGSHKRVLAVEVMGRDAGDIAIWSGISSGAEVIVIPEAPYDIQEIIDTLKSGFESGKNQGILVVAEGVMSAPELVKRIVEIDNSFDIRDVVLGHIQRGGRPTGRDRMLGSIFGAKAVSLLNEGVSGVTLAIRSEEIVTYDFGVPIDNLHHELKKISLFELNKYLV